MVLKPILGEQKILIYVSADVLYSSFSIHVFDVLSEQGCGGARIKPNWRHARGEVDPEQLPPTPLQI